MAFARFRARSQPQPLADINVTPLVDVMLVLVAILLVAAPLMAAAIRLDLPQVPTGQSAPPPGPPLALSIDAEGKLFLGTDAIDDTTLAARLRAAAAAQPDQELQLRADRTVPYGRVAAAIALAQQAGLRRIAFATTPAEPADAPAATAPGS